MKKYNLSNEDYKIIEKSLEAFDINISILSVDDDDKTQFYIFKNTDGSIRWLWPASINKPYFLNFYNVTSTRSLIFSIAVKLIFIFKLQRFIFPTITIKLTHENAIKIESLIEHKFAIFTGTKGKYRKAVCFHRTNKQDYFTKVALSSHSASILNCEYEQIKLWHNQDFNLIQVPQIQDFTYDKKLTISSIKENGASKIKAYSRNHFYYQKELINQTFRKSKLQNTSFWKSLMQDMQAISLMDNSKIPFGIKQKLTHSFKKVNYFESYDFTISHGDFTSWNSWVKDGKIYVYDLEFSQEISPLYYDIIHFHFQEEILVKHNFDGKNICTKIINFLSESFHGSTIKYLKIYLLKHIAHSLVIYNQQEVWHMQIQWLLKTWSDALSFLSQSSNNSRDLLIGDVLDQLHFRPHSILKFTNDNPYALSIKSDIDVLVDETTAKEITFYIQQHPCVEKAKVRKKSFMTSIDCFTSNGEFFSIDLIHQLKRKELTLADSSEILKSAISLSNGLNIPSYTDNFMYVWCFYTLNNHPIPEKYIEYFDSLSIKDKSVILFKANTSFKYEGNSIRNLMLNNLKLKGDTIKHLTKMPSNKGIKKLKSKINYLIDSAYQFMSSSGIIITFSGVDGAGKSTVINHVKHDLEKVYRKNVVVLRHRPSILPILSAWRYGKEKAEQISVSKLPRQGGNKNKISSIIRFLYYYIDYIIGQWVVYFKYLRRGYIVIYDRYYYDFINDSKRSNIYVSESLVKSLYTFVTKPQLNFFLYADAETITRRKQELSKPVIEELTNKYLTLFNQYSKKYHRSKYLPMENVQLDHTLQGIMQTIKTALQ